MKKKLIQSSIQSIGYMMLVVLFFASCANDDSVSQASGRDQEFAAPPSSPIAGEYIITLNESPSFRTTDYAYSTTNDMLRSEYVSTFSIADEDIIHTYGYAMNGFAAKLTKEQYDQLRQDPRIASISQNELIQFINPIKSVNPTTTAQEEPWGVQRVGGFGDGTGKTAWVIDTGIDFTHPDLNVNREKSVSFVAGTDGNDDNGHGTHVAGTIAAKNNGQGVVGVAANAEVVAVKVLNFFGSGSWADVIAGIDYVAANGKEGDAANMSLGGFANDEIDQAVQNAASKGIYFALAAGNDGQNAEDYSPARAEGENIFTVSAVDSNDELAYFSNYGDVVEFAAPGVDIYSTYMGGRYETLSGTSMASPHVCGLLLLNDGRVNSDGEAQKYPDGFTPDPIAHR
ncbi:S8 family serine peptidase [Aureivirga marina]|uniref:S8 family serine peptidase n=1 Tax=Aureivirga marina TaxID=1182451 RepID=UPI0018CAED30|nr:S8 family serine peptidase [Aureivirga marina]